MENFIEYAEGSPSRRNAVCLLKDLPKLILQAQLSGTALYRSLYYFGADFREHVQKHQTVKGFEGNAYLDKLTFDIDRGTKTDEQVLDEARGFILELEQTHGIYMGHIQPWFSGTGYHIQLYDAFGFAQGTDIPGQVKATMEKVFPYLDHSIYMKTGLIRVAHTKNHKSGLYKIPLHPKELLSLSALEIMRMAEEPRMSFRWEESLEPQTRHLSSLIVTPEASRKEKTAKGIELSNDSNGIVTCMQKLYARGERPGSRHSDIMRIASAWRRGGVPFRAAVVSLQSWARSMDPLDVEKTVADLYEKGYKYSCHDKTMLQYCDPGCIFYRNKDYAVDIATTSQMESNFVKFVNTDFASSSFDLSEFYSMPKPYKIFPGELVIVYGDTGTGKTAWVQNLCVQLKRMDILYLSLEVHQHLLFRRFIQIEHSMTRDNVVEYYKTHTNHLSDAIKHIQCITMAVDLPTVHRLIGELRPQVIVIDVIDGINVNGVYDENTKSKLIARELKQIALAQNVIIIGIHHISKAAAEDPLGKPKRMTVHSGANSATLEQKADKVIAIEGNRDELVRVVTGLKSRDETNFRLSFTVDPTTFRFKQQV